jgi:hypothetical protein
MKLTAAQKANYIKRLNNGESFNKIINTINRTTVPKTNFKSKPPFSKKLLKSIGYPTSYPLLSDQAKMRTQYGYGEMMTEERGKILRTHIMQELADLEKRIFTNVPKVYEARMRTLVQVVVGVFVNQYEAAETDIHRIHNNIWSPFSPDFLIQLKLGIRKTESETLEKVAKAGMGIISRQFSIWFTKAGYPNPAPEFWSFIVKDIEARLAHSRQKIIVTAMMRTSRNTNKFSQLNKKVQILMKSETGELYKHPIEFANKYLLPLSREHKAAKTIQKVVRGGQVRNKIRKNANNLREKVNRAEKLRSVVQASKKRKTPTPTPASSKRIKK